MLHLQKKQWLYAAQQIFRSLNFDCECLNLRPEFFYQLIYKPSYSNFPESEKKKKLISIFFILSAASKYYLFRWKKKFWGSVCVFLRVTLLKLIVLSRDLIQTVGLPITSLNVTGDIKKEKKKALIIKKKK